MTYKIYMTEYKLVQKENLIGSRKQHDIRDRKSILF